jgi:hypothetical protein
MGAFGRDRLARPVVVAFGAPPVGKYPDATPDDLAERALREALEALELPAGALDGLYLAAAGYGRPIAPLRTQRVAERLGVATRAARSRSSAAARRRCSPSRRRARTSRSATSSSPR